MVLPLWHALIVLSLTFKLLWINASAKWLHVNVALLHLYDIYTVVLSVKGHGVAIFLSCLAVEFTVLRQ